MQHQLPNIDFTGEAEVRAKAESRRTEEVASLLKAFFAWWTPRLSQSGRPILEVVQQRHRPAVAGRS
jgi:hypothetical protein